MVVTTDGILAFRYGAIRILAVTLYHGSLVL